MSVVLEALARHAVRRPDAPALQDERGSLSYSQTAAEVSRLASVLAARGARVVGLLADNCAGWSLWDLAALKAGATLVPLPGFFSGEQLRHVLRDAGVDTLIGDDVDRSAALLPPAARAAGTNGHTVAGRRFELHTLQPASRPDWAFGIAKVTYTSGTTGTPKGVLLRARAMEQVAASLVEACGAGAADRHLALLPLPTLLENVGGIYAPLLAGGTAVLYPQAQVGMHGASRLDAGRGGGAARIRGHDGHLAAAAVAGPGRRGRGGRCPLHAATLPGRGRGAGRPAAPRKGPHLVPSGVRGLRAVRVRLGGRAER
ncbi:MAG: long-chain fatty acid--CoA ligase, partial [Gammaproteobacteria bacterium]|nr:long-chain fatty acid--CoA ligase [Gammaproteobacteria bacterium]NIR97696.1 long-chain fatty acid--CoA ligase [Gammaproteobacteria bacterium]NIT62889.1 long-chain fatty acid--CoA ligase [Gammaproteobacteria bacterium]NIV19854.1 AMP-binding protein [Gammaproteobacteria bacterium]NIX11367.1 AMP-binding protein [Gammaproteobacteria bacterium]